jgi:hypothetical protein
LFGTDLIVRNGLPSGPIAQFQAGPLFWFYPLYLFVGAVVTSLAIFQSRRSALTPTQRRRLSYLGATFAAPGIGVFPVSGDRRTGRGADRPDPVPAGNRQRDRDQYADGDDLQRRIPGRLACRIG